MRASKEGNTARNAKRNNLVSYCVTPDSDVYITYTPTYKDERERYVDIVKDEKRIVHLSVYSFLPEREERYLIAFGDRLDEENIQGAHDKLIVAISTTYPIKNVDMDIIDKDNTMLRYILGADTLTLGFDFFSSVEKSYTNRFVSDIRRLIKDYNISTVHILISSSVPFTFYFAQQLNT